MTSRENTPSNRESARGESPKAEGLPIIDLIAGARPNFMKVAPIFAALDGSKGAARNFSCRFVHTGQHYDRSMSEAFFDQLGIPEPDLNLGVGSGTQAEQTAAVMTGYERVLRERRCDLCVVVGDVNSTMACAIVARKMGVPVAHVEGGIRSGDWAMPEEVNRVVTDSITNWFFTTSETANRNLRAAGVTDDRIFFVGNTMIDTLLRNLPRLRPPTFWRELGLEPQGYFVITLHRPANVDEERTLAALLKAIAEAARGLPVIFPVHPRTAERLRGLGHGLPSFHYVEPQPYLEFNYLVRNAKAVLTDSGGITEETTVLGVPCLTIRDNTERPETVTTGTNELVGTDPAKIAPAIAQVLDGKWKKGAIPEKWDGHAAERIVEHLRRLIA